jgi:hypothetical protein
MRKNGGIVPRLPWVVLSFEIKHPVIPISYHIDSSPASYLLPASVFANR